MDERSQMLSQLKIDAEARQEGASPIRWVVLAVLVVAGAAVAWWFWQQANQPTLVTVATATQATASTTGGAVLDGSGYVVARRQATVSAKTTGKVVEVLLEEGMQVEEGQILARIDPSNTETQLELARAQLASARTRLAETEVALREARREYTRQQELSTRKLTSQQALDQARANVDTLTARLTSARSEIRVAEVSTQIYDQQIDDTVIRAPFAGMVIAKAAQPGEMISPISAGGGFTRTGIGTIVDMNSLEVEIDVSESFIARVKPGQKAQITLNSYPDDAYPGYVIAIIPTADRTKATVKVRVGFEKRDARVLPEMGARVKFLSDTGAAQVAANPTPPKGVIIPAAAVSGGSVYVLADGKLARREVSVAETIGSTVRVETGLNPGDRVVTGDTSTLSDGQAVRTQ